jgi:DNA-binding PadR family transcriptional regulator
MPRNPPKAKVVTERDLAIMRLLGTDGVSNLETIHEKFWPQEKPRTCRERLAQLEKAGWLESHFVDTRGKKNQLVFTLTAQGAKQHFNQVERKFMITKLPAYNEVHQQLMAQRSRFILEEQLKGRGLELIGWNNERKLRSEARLQQHPGSRAWGALGGVADAQAVIVNPATGETNLLNIEVDGAYYGKVLREKIARIASAGNSTIWVTTPDRATRISNEVGLAGAGDLIEIMVIS